MILNTILTILGVLFLVFFESFLLAFVNFRFSIVLFFFLFKKIDWKLLIISFAILFFVFDVVKNFPLGTNLLIVSVVLGVMILASLFFSTDTGLSSFFIRTFVFFLYYILLLILPPFFTVGTLGTVSIRNLVISLFKGIISALLVAFFDNMFTNFRKRGNSSQIRLK